MLESRETWLQKKEGIPEPGELFCQKIVEASWPTRMIPLCKFVFFNVILALSDVSTDLATFFDLSNDDHPLWAALTASWMTTPFCIHAFIFLIKWFVSACILEFQYIDCVQDHRSQVQEGSDGLCHLWWVCPWLLQRGRRPSPLCLLRSQPLESQAALRLELWTQQLQAGFYILCYVTNVISYNTIISYQ